MMAKQLLVIGLNLLSICLFLRSVYADNRREDLIQDSVRRLLGVRPGVDRIEAPGKSIASLPPRYVMDLYEKYRSGRTPMQGNTVRSILPMRDTIGDADVLIFNLTGINSSEQILQSKLYLLKRRKPKPGKKREGSSHFRLKIGSLPHMTSERYVDVSLTRHKPEWHSYDITESVVHCRQQSKNGDNLLGVTLDIKRSKGSYRLSPFRRLLKHDSQPFLLIFSEDSNNQSQGSSKTIARNSDSQIQGVLQAKIKHGIPVSDNRSKQEESSEDRLFENRRKRSVKEPVFKNNNSPKTVTQSRSHGRLKRISSEVPRDSNIFQTNAKLLTTSIWNFHFERHSLFNGMFSDIFNVSAISESKESVLHDAGTYFKRNVTEIISWFLGEYKNSFTKPFMTSFKGYFEKVLLKILKGWMVNSTTHADNAHETDILHVLSHLSRSKRSISSTSATSKELNASDAMANTFQTVGEKYQQRVNSSARASTRRRNRQRGQTDKKQKKKRRRNQKLPFWWTKHNSRLHSQDYGKLCQRKSLVVDFVKLGWGDWVISPKSFNAHYCSGSCSFPLIKNANPSNHAAIQSLVHAIGLSPNVPTPCCVPSLSSPLTLLYFDEHGNLVLKNYPNMIVDKCACR